MPPQPRAPRTAPRRSARAPGPRAVVWGSLTLFAVLFTLLTFQLSASAAPGGGSGHRPVATRAETEAPETEAPEEAPEVEVPEEGTEFETSEIEAIEAEAAEIESEAPAEEIPPVVTSSS